MGWGGDGDGDNREAYKKNKDSTEPIDFDTNLEAQVARRVGQAVERVAAVESAAAAPAASSSAAAATASAPANDHQRRGLGLLLYLVGLVGGLIMYALHKPDHLRLESTKRRGRHEIRNGNGMGGLSLRLNRQN